MKFVLATANPGKIKEMRDILASLNIDIVTRQELGIDIDLEETGTTFFDNATIKATAICRVTGLPAIADDSGLSVEALGGAPGVYSSSYGGEGLNDIDRCRFLLRKMISMEQRNAKFVCFIVCVFPDGRIISAEGECSGEITDFPRGNRGFGYDPVFRVESIGKTMAEMTMEEKNGISHRSIALRAFSQKLKAAELGL